MSRDIIPSTYGVTSTPRQSDGNAYNDVLLRFGEVQQIIYPDDKQSRTGKVTEYNVWVQYHGNGHGVPVMYNNCRMGSLFGGVADDTSFTLRVPETPSTKEDGSKGLGLGSKVYILCQDGVHNNAIIVACARDPKAEDKDAKDKGHHYYSVFNGVSMAIDKDGQLTVTYGGKTNIDGKKHDDAKDEQVGSFVTFSKNGNISVSDKDGKNQLLIDHENKKVIVKRDEAFELGDATDKMLLGQSFRDAQKQMHETVQKLTDQISTLRQQQSTALTTASGKIAGPFMSAGAAVDFAQAGALGITISELEGQVAEAIGQFEQAAGKKSSFLSKKNKAD